MTATAIVFAANAYTDPLMGEADFIDGLDIVQRIILAEAGGVEQCAGGWALGGWTRRLSQTLLMLAQFKTLEVTILSDGSAWQDAAATELEVEVRRCTGKVPRSMRLREAPDDDSWSAAIAYGLDGRNSGRALVIGRWDAQLAQAVARRLTYRLSVGSSLINVDNKLGFLERDAYSALEALPLPRGVVASRVSLEDASPEPI